MSSKMKNSEQSNKVALTRVPKLRFPEFRDSASWDKKELNKLLTIGSGKDYKHLSMGNIPVYGSGGYMLSVNDYLYDGESVCIGRKGTIDKPIFLTGKFWTVDTLFYTHSFIKCSPKFIFYQFQKINWKNYNEAGGIPSLSKTTIGKIEIRVPSFGEQQKIADCLSSLDNIISLQTQKIDALQQYKKGLMQKLFPAEGETVPELRFSEFLNDPEWKLYNFCNLIEQVIDFRGRTPLKLGMEWGNGNIISLSANNVKNGYIDYNAECNLGSEDLYHKWMGKVNLEKGDIVFTMEAPLGNALLIPDERKYILSQRVVAFKTRKKINNKFFIQLIWGQHFQNTIRILSTGSTAKGINQKSLNKIYVRVPSLDEQVKISKCFSSLDDLITAETQKLATLKTHKIGLMQQLFPAVDEVNA
ncbi:TPA: restriction endonuclease subunit S [Raoultella ornithinolytica]